MVDYRNFFKGKKVTVMGLGFWGGGLGCVCGGGVKVAPMINPVPPFENFVKHPSITLDPFFTKSMQSPLDLLPKVSLATPGTE